MRYKGCESTQWQQFGGVDTDLLQQQEHAGHVVGDWQRNAQGLQPDPELFLKALLGWPAPLAGH